MCTNHPEMTAAAVLRHNYRTKTNAGHATPAKTPGPQWKSSFCRKQPATGRLARVVSPTRPRAPQPNAWDSPRRRGRQPRRCSPSAGLTGTLAQRAAQGPWGRSTPNPHDRTAGGRRPQGSVPGLPWLGEARPGPQEWTCRTKLGAAGQGQEEARQARSRVGARGRAGLGVLSPPLPGSLPAPTAAATGSGAGQWGRGAARHGQWKAAGGGAPGSAESPGRRRPRRSGYLKNRVRYIWCAS